MEINRKNHYIPQFYIKNWSRDENSVLIHRLIVSNDNVKKWEKKSVKGIGFYSNLYIDVINNTDDDSVEKWLNESVETPAKQIIDKIILGDKISQDEYQIITRFVFAQYVRTPKYFKENVDSWKKTVSDFINNIDLNNMIDNNIYKDASYNNKNDGSEHLPIRAEIVTNEDSSKSLKVETTVGKGYWLFSIKHSLTNTINKLPNYKWSIYQAPLNFKWVTSDNPVIVLNYMNQNEYDFKGGWGKKNCNIICPISPSHLLVTQVGTNQPSYFIPPLSKAKEIQKLLFENADEFIISINEIEEVDKIRKRTVNRNYYNDQVKVVQDWIKLHYELEKEYKKRK